MANVNRINSPQNYRTPPELLAACEARFGHIVFDAACTREDAVADAGWCYPEIDALTQDWSELAGVGAVWCNPPWRLAAKFAACAARSGAQVMLNVQLAPDADWYARHVHGQALVLALSPRVPYLGTDGAPAFVDKRGKALGINRPAAVIAYGFGEPGFEPWRWRE